MTDAHEYTWQVDDDAFHPHVRDLIMELSGYALGTRHSLPEEIKSNPVSIVRDCYFRLAFEPEDQERAVRLLAHLAKIRLAILHAIEDARIEHPSIKSVNRYLREKEQHSSELLIRYISAWIRNMIAATNIAPIFRRPYAEKADQLGGRLYHVEDIMLTIMEELPSKPNPSSAILTTDAS